MCDQLDPPEVTEVSPGQTKKPCSAATRAAATFVQTLFSSMTTFAFDTKSNEKKAIWTFFIPDKEKERRDSFCVDRSLV